MGVHEWSKGRFEEELHSKFVQPSKYDTEIPNWRIVVYKEKQIYEFPIFLQPNALNKYNVI
jgi:hypothetical protein